MGNSRKPGISAQTPRHLREQFVFPARTPGTLGINDAGDPNRFSLLGDTPGPLGHNDSGSPHRLSLPGLRTFHEWIDEASAHLQPQMQIGYYYAAGRKQEVMAEAAKFIARWEGIEMFPYVPGADSGITIGVGYDISQIPEKEFREDWAELAQLSVNPRKNVGILLGSIPATGILDADLNLGFGQPKPTPMFPFKSPLFTALDRLAFAAGGNLSRASALLYLSEIQYIAIPRDLSVKVFKERSLPKFYNQLVSVMPGITELPIGVQVAMLSLTYNRGVGIHGKFINDEIFDSRWEMRELRHAVLFKDLVWIYWHFESMRRIWASKSDATSVGLVKRRDAELALMYPYVANDLRHEAFLQRHPQWK